MVMILLLMVIILLLLPMTTMTIFSFGMLTDYKSSKYLAPTYHLSMSGQVGSQVAFFQIIIIVNSSDFVAGSLWLENF